jgi:catalase
MQRLEDGPASFELRVQLAGEGDLLDDPTALWSEDREVVSLGRLQITGLAYDRDREGDVLVFDPTRVPDGVRLTDDPILLARPGAYSISVSRRTSST